MDANCRVEIRTQDLYSDANSINMKEKIREREFVKKRGPRKRVPAPANIFFILALKIKWHRHNFPLIIILTITLKYSNISKEHINNINKF